jgi:peptidoglycan/xylan/chitin deacetylase (PgdA/CDA1 family)
MLAAPAGGAGPARAADPPIEPSAAGAPVAAPAPGAEPRARLVWHGPRTERVVALTFDDGWSPATLRRIYRILVREQVAATFFVTGSYVRRAPDLWREIAAAGFPLASHSYLHRDTRQLTPRQVARDLARTRQAIERATGRPVEPMFRPPYGARNRTTDRLAAAAGFPYVVMWDVAGGDTASRPSVAEVVRSAVAGRAGSIVLLHAGPRVTPRALPAIIARYRERGFRFVTVPELLGLPAAGAPAGAGDADQGPPPAAARSRAIDGSADRRPGHPSRNAPAVGSGAMPAPAGGADTPERPPPQPARDAAWARDEGTPMALAGLTAVGVLLLVAVAAIGGRRRPGAPPA